MTLRRTSQTYPGKSSLSRVVGLLNPVPSADFRLMNDVTLGTSGIGKAALLALASHNPAHIYFTGRDARAGATVVTEVKDIAADCEVTFIQCDLSASHDEICDAFRQHFRATRLDIFIANAGIMAVPPGLTVEGFELQFGTNYLGHAVMLRLLRPLMLRTAKLSDDSDVRLVVLSSFGHTMHPAGGIDFENLRVSDAGTKWQRYGQSKLADILLAKGMAKRYPEITSLSVHPGLVRTQLGGRAAPSVLRTLLMLFLWTPLYVDAKEGAYNTLWASTVPKGKLQNGSYYEPVGKKAGKAARTSGMANICDDDRLADKLWDWTDHELESLEPLPSP